MTTTDFLGFEKPSKDDRIKIDVLNDNTDKIDNHFKRNSIVLSKTGKNISVDATGPYYTVTNNTEDSVQVLLEGTMSIILDPGETQKAVKNTAEVFNLTASCDSDITVTYFQRNKDYIDNSLTTNLSNYYDKDNSDGRYLKLSDFGAARNEESSSVCSVDMPLKYTAYGNDVEQYKVYGKTSQAANPSPDFPKDVNGVGNLVTDPVSEHYGQYEIPIVCNGTTYNVYLDKPLYETNSVRDYIDYGKQKVIRKTGVITYDGSSDENWVSAEYQATYSIDAAAPVVDTTDQNFIGHMYCDKLTSSAGVAILPNRIAITNSKITVHFDSSLTSVELFVAYLQSNPITVYFPLAETIEENVVLPDLPSIQGENQLYVDTDILPSIVSVSAALQYFSPREMYESFPSKTECDNNFAAKTHSHNYAGADSAGGSATSAKKLDNTTAIGSATQPVYFNSDGAPIPTSYTVEKSVPSDAKFTDTTYGVATTSTNGLLSSTDKKKINIAEPQFAYCTVNSSSTGYYKITINNASAWMMSFDVRIYHWYHCYNLCVSGYNYGENHWSSPKAITTSSTSPTKYTPVTFGYNSDGKLWFAVPAAPYTGILINDMNQGFNAPISDFSGLFTVEKVTGLTGTTQTTINAYRPVYAHEGLVVTTVPTSATATGTAGEIAYDSNYIYVCTATNTWKRAALSTWEGE